MAKFLEVGALVLAFLGFMQFWFKILYDNYFHKGEINYYETGPIVVGYGPSGPTIGLNGTIRALNKDVFVRNIDLRLVREKDRAQHNYKWAAFQSTRIEPASNQPSPMEIPSSFLISPNLPHRFNIIFNDNDLLTDLRPSLNIFRSQWYKVTEELSRIWPNFPGTSPPPEILTKIVSLIEEFSKSKIHIETFTKLRENCYWEPGYYQLVINVKTSKPDNTFTKICRFSLTEEDSRILKLNVMPILNEPIANYLRVPNLQYNWSFAEYVPE